MKMTAKRIMLGAGIALTYLLGNQMAVAQDYPTRAITVIIPFAGGSASDVVSRIMLDKMSKSMGQPIIIENRPGAGGNTGTAAARKGGAGRLHADRRRLRTGRGQPDALQDARLRPAERPRDDLAVRGLHNRRGRQ